MDQQTSTAIGITLPIVIVVVLLILGYRHWSRKKKMALARRRRRNSRRSHYGNGSIPVANGFIQGDVWDDGGGFDPAPSRRRAGSHHSGAPAPVTSGNGFIQGDVWDDGGGFDPDPARRRSRSHHTTASTPAVVHNGFIQGDVWNDGERRGHVDAHPGAGHNVAPPPTRAALRQSENRIIDRNMQDNDGNLGNMNGDPAREALDLIHELPIFPPRVQLPNRPPGRAPPLADDLVSFDGTAVDPDEGYRIAAELRRALDRANAPRGSGP